MDEAHRCADHVDDRVERPDLVKLDRIRGDAVHASLRLREALEDRERLLLHWRVERAAGEERADVGVWPMRMRMGMRMRSGMIRMRAVDTHVELRRGDPRALDAL